MSQNPEVKLARNTELAITEGHLIDFKPELYIALFFVFCQETAELLVTVYLTRDIDKSVRLSVCLSVRYVPVSDENCLTYRHSFFHHTVAQTF